MSRAISADTTCNGHGPQGIAPVNMYRPRSRKETFPFYCTKEGACFSSANPSAMEISGTI